MLPAWFTFYDKEDRFTQRMTSPSIRQTEEEWFNGNEDWSYAGVLPRKVTQETHVV